jgi:hypothetical protein
MPNEAIPEPGWRGKRSIALYLPFSASIFAAIENGDAAGAMR